MMFGTNALRKVSTNADQFWVQEVFRTIQGEGPLAGMPAVFVRMAGCNLACHFCDTDFESSEWNPTHEELLAAILIHEVPLVVFTGGEPLRQPIGELIRHLLDAGSLVQIETAGTVWPANMPLGIERKSGFTVVCSPKTGHVHSSIALHCRDWKYIVRAGDAFSDGLPMHSTQEEGRLAPIYRPKRMLPGLTTIWVQPCEEYTLTGLTGKRVPDATATKRNIDHAVDLCYRFGYRLSLQTHKMIGLP